MSVKVAFFPLPGEIDTEQIARLKAAGFRIAGIAYLPDHADVPRGAHHMLICDHPPEEHCLCRPPKPLLITTLMSALKASYDESWFFASTYETVGMGRAAKLKNVVFIPPELGALKKAVDRVLALQAPTPAPHKLERS